MSQRAIDFMVWRAGESCGWDCTAAEISQEVGISASAVRRVCRRRGWVLLGGHESHSRGSGAWACDVLMRSSVGARHA